MMTITPTLATPARATPARAAILQIGIALLAVAIAASRAEADDAPPAQYAPLPVAASSFGAVAADGWLYIYGGHVVRTHNYSTQAVSSRFDRLKLADGTTWEQLPGGPGLQGMNLAAYKGKIYRIGGMQPRNEPRAPVDNHSVAQCACYDPIARTWEALPPLPQARSSHDVVVLGDTLFVVGGWSMQGDRGSEWLDTALSLDLAAERLEWKQFKQPFERRALTAAPHLEKVYAIGGFNEEDEPERRVDIYDPQTRTWTAGPKIHGPAQNGFGPAACDHRGRLYVSVADGMLYRLNDAAKDWEKVASTKPRIVHRLVSDRTQLLVIGGAFKGDTYDLIETVKVD